MIAFVVALAACASMPVQSDPWPAVYERVAARVALVETTLPDGRDTWCSAVAVRTLDGDAWITAAHCARRPATINGWAASKLAVDELGDLAAFRLDGPRLALDVGGDPKIGLAVAIVGYEVDVRFGRVSSRSRVAPHFGVDVVATPGMSGAPVVDAAGRVVGIATTTDLAYDSTHATDASRVRMLVAQAIGEAR